MILANVGVLFAGAAGQARLNFKVFKGLFAPFLFLSFMLT